MISLSIPYYIDDDDDDKVTEPVKKPSKPMYISRKDAFGDNDVSKSDSGVYTIIVNLS